MTISNESLLDTLFERMPMGVAVFDNEGRIVRLNDMWIEFASSGRVASSRRRLDRQARLRGASRRLRSGPTTWPSRVYAGETVRWTACGSRLKGR